MMARTRRARRPADSQMTFATANEAEVIVLRFPRGVVKISGWFGDRLVDEVTEGEVLGTIGEDRFASCATG